MPRFLITLSNNKEVLVDMPKQELLDIVNYTDSTLIETIDNKYFISNSVILIEQIKE